ncbi:MAG: IclR family transcriptional regulator [Burkholderiales bacterium]|jgi:DNA-binding IclR family transcriptional regulator|nr:IclR family transcriptional regulator [Burkholderiales bacterium]
MNNTLVKGLQVLEALARSERPLGVSELALMLDMGKSNVHRLLQALVELRYVVKDETTSEYSASLKVWELGNRLSLRLAVRHAAQTRMTELLLATRESVHLSVLEGYEVLYVHKLDSPEPVRAYSEIGGRAPAHCVATGKAILAWQPEAALENFIAHGLAGHSENTITDPDDFRRELERVRNLGYAVNRGEWRDSVWGIASPIRDSTGAVVAALGVSGPSSRLKPGLIKSLAAHVIEAADAVSLDASPPHEPA